MEDRFYLHAVNLYNFHISVDNRAKIYYIANSLMQKGRCSNRSDIGRNKVDKVFVSRHPLIQHKLRLVRDRNTPTFLFRQLMHEISLLLAYEVTRDLQLRTEEIETPFERTKAHKLAHPIHLVAILRAGLEMLPAFETLIPTADIGLLGFYRNEETLKPVAYYEKLPLDIRRGHTIILDPMLATGGTLDASCTRLKERGVENIRIVCIVAAPEGIEAFRRIHPEIPIYTASLDRELTEKGWILPGLGDAGDRYFGTV